MDSETVPGFKEISTGNHRFCMVMSKVKECELRLRRFFVFLSLRCAVGVKMSKAVPNLIKVDCKTIQCEYERVVCMQLPGTSHERVRNTAVRAL